MSADTLRGLLSRSMALVVLATTLAAPGDASQTVAFVARWGGGTKDMGYSVVADAAHGLYVVGTTYSGDFPTTSGRSRAEQHCAFVTKLNALSGAIGYSSVLCSRAMTWGRAGALGANGELWVAGSVDGPGLPTTRGAPQRFFGGSRTASGAGDGFLAKWSPDGRTVPYVTYLGGSGDDSVSALLSDEQSGVWLGGTTMSPNLVLAPAAPGRSLRGIQDGFLAHADANGQLVFTTYLGGPGRDSIAALARFDHDRLVLAGTTTSSGLSANATERSHFDGFVAMFNTSDGQVEWWRSVGGSRDDHLRAVTVLSDGTIVAAGHTTSLCPRPGDDDGWLVMFAGDGTPRGDFCIGGSQRDEIHGIAADGTTVWVTGRTVSTDFPVTIGRDRPLAPRYDRPFLAHVAPLQRKVLSARILTSGVGRGHAVIRSSRNFLYVTGETTGANGRFLSLPEHEIRPTKGAFGFGQHLDSTDSFVIGFR